MLVSPFLSYTAIIKVFVFSAYFSLEGFSVLTELKPKDQSAWKGPSAPSVLVMSSEPATPTSGVPLWRLYKAPRCSYSLH